MSLLSGIGARIGVSVVERAIRRAARDLKFKKKGYRQGYADCKAGKPARY